MKIETPTMKTSYSIGLDMGANLLRLPIDIDIAVVLQGISDAYSRKEPAITREEFMETMQAFHKKMQEMQIAEEERISSKNIEAGQRFMEENGKKSGVTTLPSGVQIEILREGEGEKPVVTDKIKVHYSGKLLDGREFDNSYSRNEPIEFPLNQVIPGWQEAFPHIKVGSMAKLVIPAEKAYGPHGNGPIPPGATLIFDVELLEIVK